MQGQHATSRPLCLEHCAPQINEISLKVSPQPLSLMSLCAISQEIKSAKEAEIQNRVEVGMDLDDEVPSLGGLIEQPALQMAEGEQNNEQDQDQNQDQPSPSPSKAKKRRVEASGNSTLCHFAASLYFQIHR